MIERQNAPASVAVIMDGNGRWAKKRGLPRTAGHSEGLKAAKRIVRAASAVGVRFLTLYAFSTENWKRARTEVVFLFDLIKKHLRAEYDFYKENNVKIKHIGDIAALPADVLAEIRTAEEDTANFDGMTVVLAVNYGGRDEIVRAAKKIEGAGEEFSEEKFSENLDFPVPDADLIIRTGGEKRLSNFLLWQSAYAELYFCDALWPDFSEDDFLAALDDFSRRTRRFGDAK